MSRIRLHLAKEHLAEVQQHSFLSLPVEERREHFVCPYYVYDPDERIPDQTNAGPICWQIIDPLHSWLKDQGLTYQDVAVDVSPIFQRKTGEGWVIWLPKRVAVMYKLTWL